MPQRVTKYADKKPVKSFQPGYEWSKSKFGPRRGNCDGVPRKRKEELDRMSDAGYQREVDGMANTNRDMVNCLMISERERLRTLQHKGEVTFSPAALANNGFYFANKRIHCAFCYVSISPTAPVRGEEKWDQLHAAGCDLFTGKAKDNIPLKSRTYNTVAPSSLPFQLANIDVGTATYQRRQVPNGPELENIVKEKAKYKQFSNLEARLDSFKRPGWDSKLPIDQVELLCDAGFYFCPQIGGKGDKVICFFCNGSLEGWELADDPWKEHMQNYPRCAYLFLNRGEEDVWSSWHQLSKRERDNRDGLIYNFNWFNEFKRAGGEAPVLADNSSSNDTTREDTSMRETSGYKFAIQENISESKLEQIWPFHKEAFNSAKTLLSILLTIHGDLTNASEGNMMDVSPNDTDEDTNSRAGPDCTQQLEPESRQKVSCLRPSCPNLRYAVVIPCGCLAVCNECQPKIGSDIKECPKCQREATQSVIVKL